MWAVLHGLRVCADCNGFVWIELVDFSCMKCSRIVTLWCFKAATSAESFSYVSCAFLMFLHHTLQWKARCGVAWLWPRGHCFLWHCDIFLNSEKTWLDEDTQTNISVWVCSAPWLFNHSNTTLKWECQSHVEGRVMEEMWQIWVLQFTGAEERGRGHWWFCSTGLQVGNCCLGITRDFCFFNNLLALEF